MRPRNIRPLRPSRSELRLTPNREASSGSGGKRLPTRSSPLRMRLSMRRATASMTVSLRTGSVRSCSGMADKGFLVAQSLSDKVSSVKKKNQSLLDFLEISKRPGLERVPPSMGNLDMENSNFREEAVFRLTEISRQYIPSLVGQTMRPLLPLDRFRIF